MNIAYYHKNIDHLTDGTKSHIDEKLQTLTSVQMVDSARVEIDQRKIDGVQGQFHMSVQLVSAKNDYYATAEHADILACVEEIRSELCTQMLRDKSKMRDLVRRGARSLKKRLTINSDARL